MQELLAELKRLVATSNEIVFLVSDFDVGRAQQDQDQAVQYLTEQGLIVPIGEGIFAKARPNRITGRLMLDAPGGFDQVAKAALTKLGVHWEPGTAEKAYLTGSKQLPTRTVVRITGDWEPQIAFGGFRLIFERRGKDLSFRQS